MDCESRAKSVFILHTPKTVQICSHTIWNVQCCCYLSVVDGMYPVWYDMEVLFCLYWWRAGGFLHLWRTSQQLAAFSRLCQADLRLRLRNAGIKPDLAKVKTVKNSKFSQMWIKFANLHPITVALYQTFPSSLPHFSWRRMLQFNGLTHARKHLTSWRSYWWAPLYWPIPSFNLIIVETDASAKAVSYTHLTLPTIYSV